MAHGVLFIDKFAHYECKEDTSIGINLQAFRSALELTDNDASLTLKYKKVSNSR